MKKSLLLAGMLAVGLANAQTGKVGINTENPNETLEINGTLRVDNLPESGVGKIYDGAETTGTTFTGTRTLVADEKGNIGYTTTATSGGTTTTSQNFPVVVIGAKGGDAFERRDFILTKATRSLTTEYLNTTFTLEKRSLVLVNASLSSSLEGSRVDGVAWANNQTPAAKRLGIDVEIDGTTLINAGTLVTTGVALGDPSYQNGIWVATGSRAIVLEAGTHTIKVDGRYTLGQAIPDDTRVAIRMGNSSYDTLDVIAYPLE